MILNLLNSLAVSFDLPILDWIAANLWCPLLDTLMPIITLFGDDGIFWIAIAVLLLFCKKHRKAGLSMGLAMAIGLVVCNMIMKPAIMRPRPYDFQWDVYAREIPLLVDRMHDYSFPSGHTIASFEACTALMLYNKKLGIPATVLAILIAFSRLYLYVHYPTDVIFSVFAGILFGYIATWIVRKGSEKLAAKKKA